MIDQASGAPIDYVMPDHVSEWAQNFDTGDTVPPTHFTATKVNIEKHAVDWMEQRRTIPASGNPEKGDPMTRFLEG